MRSSKAIMRMPHCCLRTFKVSVGICIPSALIFLSQSSRCIFRILCGRSLPGIGALIEAIHILGADRFRFPPLRDRFLGRCVRLGHEERCRRELLQQLIDWRNAIAHQDFAPVAPGGIPTLHLVRVRAWRSAVNALARSFDQAMYNYLQGVVGTVPW